MSQNNNDDEDDYIALKEKRKIEAEEVKQYSKRISEKDKSKQKNYVTGQTEETKYRSQASKYQDNDFVTENLRIKSRQAYLGKRKAEKIEDIASELHDEDVYFKDVKLSKREIEDRETKKMIYKAAKIQEKNAKKLHEEYYNIPSNDSTIITNQIEVKPKSKGNRLNEWELKQLKTGIYQQKKKEKKQEDEYDILVDEFVDYEQKETIAPQELNQKEPVNVEKQEKDLSIDEVRKMLPIYKLKDELIELIGNNQIVVIEGETGSGKTTQMPQYLLEAGYCDGGKKIGCTQPRRVAAMSVAARVAQEMRVKLGDRVGYSVRFEAKVSDQTQIKYMTDGMLLREFLTDPEMADYSVIIIDEAHERTLQTDLLFSLLHETVQLRPDLKLIISSATCDVEKFCEFFSAPFFKIPGRRYQVDTYYTREQEANYVEAAVVSVLQIHITQEAGDILVFLTGQDEIEDAMDSLQERIRALGNKIEEMIVLPIYSALPTDKQAKIFLPTPPGARKVVLATNIAETSLTIDGIRYVIDCGYCKIKHYDPKSRMDSLVVVPITRANAVQRAGRAGRVGPGKCFRLYRKCTFDEEMDEQAVPEIQRTNLSFVVLLLKSLGVVDIAQLRFMDSPLYRSMLAAIEELYSLGALDDTGGLTLTGRKMVELPCDPMVARMVLRSDKYGCSEEALTIAAMLSLDNTVFYTPKHKRMLALQAHRAFLHPEGDHLTLLRVYNEYAASDFSSDWCRDNYVQARSMKMARNVRDQLVALTDRLELVLVSSPDDSVAICKAITAGFFLNTARFAGGTGEYKRIKKTDTVHLQSSSAFRTLEEHPKYVVFSNIVHTTREYMRTVTRIDPKWLTEVAPHIYKDADFVDNHRGGRHKRM